MVERPGGGRVALWDGRAWRVPTTPAEAMDADGAGDAFGGTMAVALLEGRALRAAAPVAAAISHLAVRGRGAQASRAPGAARCRP